LGVRSFYDGLANIEHDTSLTAQCFSCCLLEKGVFRNRGMNLRMVPRSALWRYFCYWKQTLGENGDRGGKYQKYKARLIVQHYHREMVSIVRVCLWFSENV